MLDTVEDRKAMYRSFEEASERLGMTLDEVLGLIIDGELTVFEIVGPERYKWAKVEEHAGQAGLRLLESHQENEDLSDSFEVLMLLEALRLTSERLEVLTQQIEAKDRQLEMNSRQLHDRAQEVNRLHQMLFASQDAVNVPNSGRHPWWKRLLGATTPENSATA